MIATADAAIDVGAGATAVIGAVRSAWSP